MQVGHFLIGAPGSGKSTLARGMAEYFGQSVVVSTDAIRLELFGTETHLGDWEKVQETALERAKNTLNNGQTVIYDATNYKRIWRTMLLEQFKEIAPQVEWFGWQLNSDLDTCKSWNGQRDRKVPDSSIEYYFEQIKRFPPHTSEGFARVCKVDISTPSIQETENKSRAKTTLIFIKGIENEWNFEPMSDQIQKLKRSIASRKSKNPIETHRYSTQIDFDRLMFLLSELLNCGEFSWYKHKFDQSNLSSDENYTNEISEISAVMEAKYHKLYANKEAIAADLEFLQQIGLVNSPQTNKPIEVPDFDGDEDKLRPHQYSSKEAFVRILSTLRYISNHPFVSNSDVNETSELAEGLKLYGVYTSHSALRKDIEKIFNPYNLFPQNTLKKGYFVGNSIFDSHELNQIFNVVQAAKGFDHPFGQIVLQNMHDRLSKANFLNLKDIKNNYPVTAISSHMIVDIDAIKGLSIYSQIDQLENAIKEGQVIELSREQNTGRFEGDPIDSSFFQVYPLQIVYDRIAWYLGFELISPGQKGLLRYERLDRLSIIGGNASNRILSTHFTSLKNLHYLTEVSFGIFLGNSFDLQQQVLAKNPDAEITVEIFCNDNIFKFLSEGSKRFPTGKLRMSKFLAQRKGDLDKSIHCLEPSDDRDFPHCYQFTLPNWAKDDKLLISWLFGFGNSIKVIGPDVIKNQVIQLAHDTFNTYNE